MRKLIEKGTTYTMKGVDGEPKFWLYDIESFLHNRNYVVRIEGKDFSNLRTLRFTTCPTVEQVITKYIDFYINGNFWGR